MYWLTFIFPYSARNVFFSLFCHATPWWMIHKITIQHRIILFLFHAESLSNGLGITRAQLAAPWVCGACFRLCFWGIFSLRACLYTEVRTRSKTHTRTRTRTSSKTKTRSRSKNARTHTLKSVHTYMLENAHTHTHARKRTHARKHTST